MDLAALRSYVTDRLGGSSDETASRLAVIDGTLNREYLRLVQVHRLNIETADLVLTAADPVVDLPDDWLETITIQRGSRLLRPLTGWDLTTMVAETESATPIDQALGTYILDGPNRLRFAFGPDASDSAGAVLRYVAKPLSENIPGAYGLVSDLDTPYVVPEQYQDIIAERTIYRLALAEEEPGLAAGAKAIADESERDLRRNIARRVGTGNVTIGVRGMWTY